MRRLDPDDFAPPAEYAIRRHEQLRAYRRYLDRQRRLRVGPHVGVTFENRQTLWFWAQELLYVARLTDPVRVREQLDWCNRVLAAPGLHAVVTVDGPPVDGIGELTLRCDLGDVAATWDADPAADGFHGEPRWVRFAAPESWAGAGALELAWRLGDDEHRATLPVAVRQSVLADLPAPLARAA